MARRIPHISLIWLFILSAVSFAGPRPFLDGIFPKTSPGPAGTWSLVDAFPNLTFIDPVRLYPDPRDPEKAYVVCRNGQIWQIPFSADAKKEEKILVLDLSENTLGFGDSGMMSLAFHPDFGNPDSPNRHFVYVYYQWSPVKPKNHDPATPGYLRLSRFIIPDGEARLDPSSETILIQQFDRHSWHTGGGMFFGPDRFLYLAIGDEGGSKDHYQSAQKIDDRLFGGIIRIDVDQDPKRSHPIRRKPRHIPVPDGWPPTITRHYFIPDDNPWNDQRGRVLEEFWAIGTRNPHSMSHDNETGEIYVADVGQDSREEITITGKGGNHQWPYREGNLAGPAEKPSQLIGKDIPPVFDYDRSLGGCVIGGMVYRGSTHAGTLTGTYIFGDHTSRGIHSLDRTHDGDPDANFLASLPHTSGEKSGLSGISEGADGEPYFLELGETGTDTGKIRKLVRSGPAVAEPPALLSQTGAFTDLARLSPSPGLIPYSVISPLWTDGAAKQRWIALPDGRTITFREQGAWDFPAGTVLVKHFALPVDDNAPEKTVPVETRFFVHGEDGNYYGVTYRWNEEGTDAHLVSRRETRTIPVTGKDGKPRQQTWTFPSRSDCFTCHTAESGSVLGLRSHQFSEDQLTSWNRRGLFGDTLGNTDPSRLHRAVDPKNPHASLDHRVASYLDANCAHCHHPSGVSANFDTTFHLPLSSRKMIRGTVIRPLTGPSDRIVSPGDAARSVLHARASVTGEKQMPPLGKNLVDHHAAGLIEEWILSLDDDSFPPNTQTGLQADYYKGSNFDELVLSRTDPAIDFDWGNTCPAGEIGPGPFSIRWHGEIHPPGSGSYTFIATNDDGIRVIVNGVKVIDSWADQPTVERSGPITLTAGHPADITVEFYKATPGSNIRLEWSGPATPREIIPESAFRRSSATTREPVAEDDSITLEKSGPTRFDVLNNDVGPNAPLGIHGVAIVDPPAHGTLRIDGRTRKLIYTPSAPAATADRFTYTVTDSRGIRSNPATVELSPP